MSQAAPDWLDATEPYDEGMGLKVMDNSRSAAGIAVLLVQAMLLACTPPAAIPPAQTHPSLLPSMQVYTSGEAVSFLLQVTNVADAPVEVNFPTGQTYDFVVTQNGEEVWRWSEGQMFTQAIHQIRLRPGETFRFEAEWQVPAGVRGEFEVSGVVPGSDHRVVQATRFDVQ